MADARIDAKAASKTAKYGFLTAMSVVVANMIGTGVFTSLGFQLATIQSGFAILLLWVVGGVAAFCGALSYAELGAALPRSGGEYSFMGRIYHPAAGFVSGWVSATIAFAAPVALAAITFSAYGLSVVAEGASYQMQQIVACSLVVILALVHGSRRSASGGLQKVFTLFKVIVIIAFCVAAVFLLETPQPIPLMPVKGDGGVISSGAFAVALIYVSFAYAGWNSATYITGEIDNPKRNLPRILGLGTLIVTILYVALNAVFLKSAPIEDMVGKVEIGFIAAQSVFGETGGNLTGLIMASLMISTVSAMTIAGPRVLQMIGEDFSVFRMLGKVNKDGIPSRAIYVQSALAIAFIITSSFDSILVFAGFVTALNSFFTVLGLFVLRWREPSLNRPYKAFAYPVTPLIYLTVTGWILIYALVNRPTEGLFGLGLIVSGFIFYHIANSFDRIAA
jgi:basic amino acid/polyamine antiporter, APA family